MSFMKIGSMSHIFLRDVKRVFPGTFHVFLRIWAKFGIDCRHVMLFSSWHIPKYRHSEKTNFTWRTKRNFTAIFLQYLSDSHKIRQRRRLQTFVEGLEFRRNRRNKRRTSLRGVNWFLSILPKFIFWLAENRCKITAQSLLSIFVFCKNLRREGRTFLIGVNEKSYLRVPFMKAYGWSRGITPLIRNLDTRWMLVVRFTTLPLYPLRSSPWYPLNVTEFCLGSEEFRQAYQLSWQPLLRNAKYTLTVTFRLPSWVWYLTLWDFCSWSSVMKWLEGRV